MGRMTASGNPGGSPHLWGMRGHLLEEKASTPAPGATVVPLSPLTRESYGEKIVLLLVGLKHCKFSNYIFQLLCEC